MIEDKSLPQESFEELAIAIGRARSTLIRLDNSDLSAEKLRAFGEGCQKNKIAV